MISADTSLLMALLSMIVHADEFFDGKDDHGRATDKNAFKAMLSEPRVKALMAEADKMCLLPVRRDGVKYKP